MQDSRIVADAAAVNAPGQTGDFPFHGDVIHMETPEQVDAFDAFADLQDIAGVFVLNFVIHNAPESQNVILNALEFNQRGSTVRGFIQFIYGKLYVSQSITADGFAQLDRVVVSTAQIAFDGIRVGVAERIGVNKMIGACINVRNVQRAAKGIVIETVKVFL